MKLASGFIPGDMSAYRLNLPKARFSVRAMGHSGFPMLDDERVPALTTISYMLQ
ncbi:hypothetical protein [Paenibacillus konkukensis]|uniref:hypothetical protein n=1 Tax=Paenibacillus konkukensis TaxID=2020716 RepID=UPI00201D6B11|nr:hypothetical protein [Paenibacillus konkukensis]